MSFKIYFNFIFTRIAGAFIYICTYLVKRNSNIWVFGSYGNFNDNSKYLFLYVIQNCPEIKAIWISKNIYESKILKNSACRNYYHYRWSPMGIFYTLKAKYYFFNSYVSDINYFTSRGAIFINLWHGIPLKKIEFSIESGPLTNKYQRKWFNLIKYPEIFVKPNYLLSTSNFVTVNAFISAFEIDESRCLNFGYPRNDIFFYDQNDYSNYLKVFSTDSELNLINKINTYNKVFLYMPTWREYNHYFLEEALSDLELLNNLLHDKEYLMLLKLHHNTPNTQKNKFFSNIIYINDLPDVYSVLKNIDVLITDYSSIYFDFLLLRDKNIILFPFDKDEYINSRGFYFNYDEFFIGYNVYNFNDLLNTIYSEKYNQCNTNDLGELRSKLWENFQGDSSKTLVNYFKNEAIKN